LGGAGRIGSISLLYPLSLLFLIEYNYIIFVSSSGILILRRQRSLVIAVWQAFCWNGLKDEIAPAKKDK